jgi:YHS domain-containing protein
MKITLALSALLLAAAPLFAADAPAKKYPLTTCVVSGEPLDSMGGPMIFEYKGTEVRLCCKSCKKKFDKNPNSFIEKIKGT